MIKIYTLDGPLNVDRTDELIKMLESVRFHPEMGKSLDHALSVQRVVFYLKNPAMWWRDQGVGILERRLAGARNHVGDLLEHEDMRDSIFYGRLRNALKATADLLRNPAPRAWDTSSDSDVLRCPLCLARVPGCNPWRTDKDTVEPMNAFAVHADSIYSCGVAYQCPGCHAMHSAVNMDGKPPAKTYKPGEKRDEVVLMPVEG